MPAHHLPERLLLLIAKLAELPEIKNHFYLAGGTALAYQLGHRLSEDLDLFSGEEFDVETLAGKIISLNGRILVAEAATLHTIIDQIKVSFLYYPYPVLFPFQKIGDLSMAALGDIACMKAVAISQRPEKKDFYDMMALLKIFRPMELKEMFMKKYGHQRINCYHILKSFFFFADVEASPDPISLDGTTWEDVKRFFLDNEKTLTRDLCLEV